MSCRYKEECPSYSGWCERRGKQDFSKCIPFLITTYENAKKELEKYHELCLIVDKLCEVGLDTFGIARRKTDELSI